MNAVTQTIAGELAEEAQFFAPMSADLVDSLVGQYNAALKQIQALSGVVRADNIGTVLHYFVEGNVQDQRYSMPATVETLFRAEGAIAKLNADYWNRALLMTDVYDYMPQARREQWHEQIRSPEGVKANRHTGEKDLPALPAFEESTVRSTLNGLLNSRAQFLAERVDGIFRALSRQHVTNTPQGFNKRMIIQGVFSYQTAGHINDLRCVIAKFMGRDEPKHCGTDPVIKAARRKNGEWQNVDGGALRIRVYGGVGTAHLEVHPDMAWRLNAILASLYPLAIPTEFREKPKRQKKIKDFELFDKPLPFVVVAQLAGMREGWRKGKDGWRDIHIAIPNTRTFDYGDYDKAARKQAEEVLRAIGGVFVDSVAGERMQHWAFDYEPTAVLDQIICSGCIPDQKSHQYYPTPHAIAEFVASVADVHGEELILEPSAGTGGLASWFPALGTTCVEISSLHCKVLEAKGYEAIEADFLTWKPAHLYDLVVMNPPFSEGRWLAHLQHAAPMLKRAGRLIAVLPARAKGKDLLPGWNMEWARTFDNEFAGTSVSVVVLIAQREGTKDQNDLFA
jgi:hypothetical protein